MISNASDAPIYEQIAAQIRDAIAAGELSEGDALPSIRALANDLRVSVITTKRAYAELEQAGFVDAVQGRGFFVAAGNAELVHEQALRDIESNLTQAIEKARRAGVDTDELHGMLDALVDIS